MKECLLSRLPNEIIVMITKYLSKNELLCIRNTTRRMNNIVLSNLNRTKCYLRLFAHQRQPKLLDAHGRVIEKTKRISKELPEGFRRFTIVIKGGTKKNKQAINCIYTSNCDVEIGTGMLDFLCENLKKIPYSLLDLDLDLHCRASGHKEDPPLYTPWMKDSISGIVGLCLYKAFSDVIFYKKPNGDGSISNIAIYHLSLSLQRPFHFIPLMDLLRKIGIPHVCVNNAYISLWEVEPWIRHLPSNDFCFFNGCYVHLHDFVYVYEKFSEGALNIEQLSSAWHKRGSIDEKDLEWDKNEWFLDLFRNGQLRNIVERKSDGQKVYVLLRPDLGVCAMNTYYRRPCSATFCFIRINDID